MPSIRVKVRRTGPSTIALLANLSERNVRKAIAPRAAFEIQKAVKRQFATQRDPYNKRWKKKQKPDGRPVLTGKTRKLSRNIGKAMTPRGFEVSADTDYASFHNRGTRHLPQRKIFPQPAQGLPRGWKRILDKISREEIRKLSR